MANKVKFQKVKAPKKKAPQQPRQQKQNPPKTIKMPSIGRQLLQTGGSALGTFFGGPAGGAMGNSAGGILSNILGFGDYAVSKNSLVTGNVPTMHGGQEEITIKKREYLGDISSGLANTWAIAAEIPLNPGLAASFPFLSAIAQNFQECSINGMVFEFVSTSGNALNSTNTALGSVQMFTQYRSNANPPTNKIEAVNEYFSTDAKPSENFMHAIECDPKERPLNIQYVRGAAVPAGDDPKLYDLGTFYVGVSGMQAANVNVGELWVTYDVTLRKPIPTSNQALYSNSAHYVLTAPAVGGNYFGTSRTAYFTYPSGLVQNQDNIGITVTGSVITFPAGTVGNYLMCYSANGASTAALAQPTHAYVNCLNYLTALNNHTGSSTNNNGTTAAQYMEWLFINIVNPQLPATITFSGGLLPATPTFGDLLIVQWNGSSNLAGALFNTFNNV